MSQFWLHPDWSRPCPTCPSPIPTQDIRQYTENCQNGSIRALRETVPVMGNCNSSHNSIPLTSSFIHYINRLPLQGLTQSSSHKSIPVKPLGLLTQKTQRPLETGQSPACRVNPSAHPVWLPQNGVSPWQISSPKTDAHPKQPGLGLSLQAGPSVTSV